MDKNFRMKYLESIKQRYLNCPKDGKSVILSEFCRVCGYDRKYAITLLHKLDCPPPPRKSSKRPIIYGPDIHAIVLDLWEESNFPWSVRLKAIVKLWLPWIRRRHKMNPKTEALLLAASKSTLDRILAKHRNLLKKRIYGKTKPGSLLKRDIPIRTDFWDINEPGWLEIDLVSHSGPCAFGDFIFTLNATDIYSGWVESRAVFGKTEAAVRAALEDIIGTLPFIVKGVDSDNGSEFINWHLYRYCGKNKIQFTRSRPYKKDDNAHIEQKNWTHVRKLIGWDRYDSARALALMQSLYTDPLRAWMNLFQPSVKLLKTIRRGSKTKKIYSAPETPIDRLAKYEPALAAELIKLRATLDPFVLSGEIAKALAQIWKAANIKPNLKELAKTKERLVEEAVTLISRRLEVQDQAHKSVRSRIPAMV